jgi:hypothetical protein
MKWLWAIAGLALALGVLSACGGSEKAARSFSDADLKNIVTMTGEGLSMQLVVQNDAITSNAQAAQTFMDPQKWLNNYEKWGRTGGHTATYGTPAGKGASLQAQAEAYKTVGGAKSALSAVRDFMTSGEALLTYRRVGYTDARIDVIDAAPVGDESSSYRLTVSYNGKQLDTLVIIFRRGPVLAQASVGVASDTTETTDVEAVATQMDGRIQNILNTPQLTSSGG